MSVGGFIMGFGFFIISVFSFIFLNQTSVHADGGGLFELAKVHKAIFNQCYNKAKYEPGLTENDFQDVPVEEVKYLYVFNFNAKNTVAFVETEHQKRDFKCREWLPYLSWVYFYDAKGDASLLRNLQKRFCQEREFDLPECESFKSQNLH